MEYPLQSLLNSAYDTDTSITFKKTDLTTERSAPGKLACWIPEATMTVQCVVDILENKKKEERKLVDIGYIATIAASQGVCISTVVRSCSHRRCPGCRQPHIYNTGSPRQLTC